MNIKTALIVVGILIIAVIGFVVLSGQHMASEPNIPVDSAPQHITLSGTYECLPHANPDGPQTMECAFGLVSDSGDHYAVNFGASADAMQQFQAGSHITAEGDFVPKEALNSDQWNKYNMKGIFTVTKMIDATPTPAAGAKLDINVVCQSALTYMTFPDGASADKFVAECKEGKHPEVIDHYKAQMNLGEGANI
jgi:hypothetical protein